MSKLTLAVVLAVAFVLIFGALDLLPWQWDQLPSTEEGKP